MTTLSHSHLTNSRYKADRIVDELSAAGFSQEEVSVLIPEEGPAAGSLPTNRAGDPAHDGRPCAAGNILVSVHLADGSGMRRAEEIFGRDGCEANPPARSHDERPESWIRHRAS